MTDERFPNRLSPAARISLGYLILGVIWILFSDRFAHDLFPQPNLNEVAQTLKGWIFVLVTSLFLYAICRGYLRTIEKQLQETNRTNRSLRIISQCNQALVKVREEGELLDSICRLLVEYGGYPLAWIGFVGGDPRAAILPSAMAGSIPCQAPETWTPPHESGELVASCLKTGKPAVSLPAQLPAPNTAGRGSWIALPLLQDGGVIGVLSIYSIEASAYNQCEADLLEELASNISFGVWALRSSLEKEQAHQELEETERHFRLLVEGATDHAIFLLNPQGKILSWNQGAQRVYGYTQEEILGQDLSIFLPADQEGPDISPETEMEEARTQGAYQLEGWRVRKDGSRIWVDTVLSALRDEAGEVTGYTKVTRDLTQLRLSEERVQSLNEDLERRVVERTAEIMVANQGLEMFSYSVSHDLRAPLRAISGFAEILSRRHKEGLNQEARHYLSNIIEAASRMNDLIDDLLALARVGRQAIRHEPVDTAKITEELIQETIPLAKGYGVRIHSKIEFEPSLVRTDPALFRQILLNLLTNAITYRRPEAEEGPQVWIHLRLEGEDLLIEVRDNGIGIPEEYREKIFRPFQRLHTHEDYPGSGIGLALVKKGVDLLSAKVWVTSTEGQGSVFFVQIPHCI